MSSRMRLTLLIVGLLVLCCALAAVAYAVWPLPDVRLQSTLAPTLFAPP